MRRPSGQIKHPFTFYPSQPRPLASLGLSWQLDTAKHLSLGISPNLRRRCLATIARWLHHLPCPSCCRIEATIQPFSAPSSPTIHLIYPETFLLFAQDIPSQNLGFVDSAASSLELTVAGKDLTIHQSPGILSSTRSGGTTGAVVWKVTPLFAEWAASPGNILARSGALSRSSAVLELGCGISAIVGLVLAPAVSSYTLTDQAYVSRLVEQNIQENRATLTSGGGSGGGGGRPSARSRRAGSGSGVQARQTGPSLRFATLDWETDEVTASLAGSAQAGSFDLVIACDCIYNESLIEPLVQTCVDACALGRAPAGDGGGAADAASRCVCVVAQQLRDPEIFESWVKRFCRSFHAWRVPDDSLPQGLRSSSGFVVHVGVLRG
ncbi:hypothetical protein RB595_005510 [Gaeumannomyces hyphopodioides]